MNYLARRRVACGEVAMACCAVYAQGDVRCRRHDTRGARISAGGDDDGEKAMMMCVNGGFYVVYGHSIYILLCGSLLLCRRIGSGIVVNAHAAAAVADSASCLCDYSAWRAPRTAHHRRASTSSSTSSSSVVVTQM